MVLRKILIILFVTLLCPSFMVGQQKAVRMAVVSDIHIQDTAVVRSMDAEIHSTRLFNENYFAAITALDNIAEKGIKEVILPGDLTDNGQEMNVVLVRKMLQSYTDRYGMHFYVMDGNHDPSRPFADKNVKGGLRPWGYEEIHNEWSSFGFLPRKNYLYWETPFTTYSYPEYRFDEALKQASWTNRIYALQTPDGKSLYKPFIQEGSYLVEPVKGVWLLAIDASVYHPSKLDGDSIVSFQGASGGYNEVFKVKKFLLPWIKKVVKNAKKYHKTLVAFSHYPMADYNSGALEFIGKIAQSGKFDIHRFPSAESATLLADAGITFHLGGHLHMNDDETFVSAKNNRLRNVQVPTTAGYVPAYKIITLQSGRPVKIETVALNNVAGFDAFFPRYRAEHDSLTAKGIKNIWDDGILSAKNYRQFCEWHLRELVRLRYLPGDLKPIATEKFVPMTAGQIFAYLGLKPFGKTNWTGFDMIVDFYKLRLGSELALPDISSERMNQYRMIVNKGVQMHSQTEFDSFFYNFCSILSAKMKTLQKYY